MGRLNVRLDAQELREKFFSCQGRLNRKPFIMRLLGVIVVSTIVAMIFYTLFYSLLGSKQVADGAAIVISIIEVIAIYTLVVRRLHDLGMGQPLAVIYLVIAILQPFFFRLIAELPEDSMEAQGRAGAQPLHDAADRLPHDDPRQARCEPVRRRPAGT